MRITIIILLLFDFITSDAQNLPIGIRLNDPEWRLDAVQTKMDKEIDYYLDKKELIPNTNKKWIGDTLVYNINVKTGRFTLKYLFYREKNVLRSDSRCIYQEYQTDCTHCGERQLKKTMSNKKLGLKEISPGKYLTNFKYKTNLEVNTQGSELCIIMRFTPENLKEAEYKKLYKSLKLIKN